VTGVRGAEVRAVAGPALSLALAVGVFGISFGVLASDAGLTVPQASATSLLVFAGSAQYAAVAAAGAGAAAPAVLLVGLLLNTRCLPFGLAVAPLLGTGRAARLLGAHLVIDESSALALAERDPARARAAFWVTGIAVFGCWNAATVAGALAGSAIGDPARLGLDAVFPAAFIALLAPLLRDRGSRAAAVAGAPVALALVPVLPAGLPVTVAALGVVAGLLAERRP
jgi:4-azaleucine resistance transporter AzlC